MGTLISSFFEGLFNIFIFLPHFFSVTVLIRTLFAPWKNLESNEKTVGFSMDTFLNKLSFNLVSRGIGFVMRSSLLFIFFLITTIYFLLIPFIILLFFLSYPVQLFIAPFREPQSKKIQRYKDAFISYHTLQDENKEKSAKWFDRIYKDYLETKPWWHLSRLTAIPPLGRNWTMGYTPYLDQYAQDLSSDEYLSGIRHLVGRERELKNLVTLLSKSEEANAILVGEEGIGKDAIIDTLAQKIYDGQANSLLNYKRVLRLNLERISSEFTDQKKREDFFENLLEEASKAKSVILVIDNIDRYLHVGDGYIDLSIPLEKYAKRSTLQIIGTTSSYLYQKYIFNHPRLNTLFTRIDVVELSQEDTLTALEYLTPGFENRYSVRIPYESIATIVEKSAYYITNVPFPEKAIQLLDTICAHAKENKIEIIKPDLIDTIITQKTHIPTSLDGLLKEKLLHLESALATRIIGQDAALHTLAGALRHSFVQLGKRRKPLASLLFLGPTGTGKTETAKVLASLFFGRDDRMIRFDMSEYQNKEDIPKLIGSLEHNEPGLMTSAIRNNPYGVLLLDELEKANHDLLNIFLTVIDEGYFTDGTGKTVDCKNLIIIATSNAGAKYIFDKTHDLSISSKPMLLDSALLMDQLVKEGVYTPEFINRFDGIVVYQPLSEQVLLQIGQKFMERVSKSYQLSHRINVTVDQKRIRELVLKSYHPEYGARNLERAITQEIEDIIAQKLLKGEAKAGDTITIN